VSNHDGHPVLVPPDEVWRLELLERENAQLREALSSRIVIEQAKGVLAERYRLELVQAFELLRGAARSNRMPIHALATAVTTGRNTPAEIEAALVRIAPSNGAAAAPGQLEETG
jgi:hypothetical protein